MKNLPVFFRIVLCWFSGFLPLSAQLNFDPANPPAAATPPTELYNEFSGDYAHQKGPKTVMVILVRPSDGAAWTTPPSLATLSSQLDSASQNYYSSSFQQTWFGPKRRSGLDIPRLVVTPVLTLPRTTAEYVASFSSLTSDAVAFARNQGGSWNGGNQDPDHFDRVVIMSNSKLTTSTGLANVRGRFAWTNNALSGSVAEHEWGHNWGVVHANAWNVAPGEHPRADTGVSEEYKDGWCLMGGGNTTHGFNPQFLENLGFLERARGEALDITASGTYRLHDYRHPRRRTDGGLVRALILPMHSFTTDRRVILGFGHLPGTDGGLSRTDWNRNAVTVYSKLSDGANRIDTTPYSRQSGDADDSSIKIGRTYSEGPTVNGTQMYGGFHVTPVARGNTVVNGVAHEWIDVVVNYQNSISNNQPPTAAFSASILGGAVPGTGYNLSVTASDLNGDALAYDWDFGDGSYSLSSAATQTKTWSAPGLYLVTCTVSDMKGGTAVARAWVNVGNVAFRTPENPSSTLAGLDYRYTEGAYSLLPDFERQYPVLSGSAADFSLAPRLRNDNFGFVWEGYLDVPASDVYSFHLRSDDGSRLFIGDTRVVDNDGVKASALEASGNIALSAGLHRLRVEFFHRDGTESLSVDWSTLTSARAPIPASALRRPEWGSNAVPEVSLTSPADGSSVIVGGSVPLQASATDSDGIARVAFFANGSYLGESSAAPHGFLWSDLSAGGYTLHALAFDTTGRWTLSAPVALDVVSPPMRDMIGINFVDRAGASGTLDADQTAGAFYTQPNWNNAPAGTYTTTAWSATLTGLRDQTGGSTAAWARYRSRASDQHGYVQTLSDISTPNGRLLRGAILTRDIDLHNPEVEVYGVPYLQYDVYVYFDLLETIKGDQIAQEIVLTPEGGPPQAIWGRNSRTLNDGTGDYPSYDTWVGFREATAASPSAPEAEQLGNYVVFRGVTSGRFHLTARKNPANKGYVAINAVQIVSQEPSAPAVALLQTDGATAVAEGGASDNYAVVLAYPPTANVTVNISPDAQLVTDRSSLLFTPQTWNQPQLVNVSAVDDTLPEGAHTGIVTHSVTSTGNYAGLAGPSLAVAVADDDQPTVQVHAAGSLREGQSGTATYTFVRSNVRDLSQPTTVYYQMSGSATPGTDHNLPASGSVVIPGGQSRVDLSISAANDSAREYTETATLTIAANALYTIGSPGSATVSLFDDDATDHLAEAFQLAAYGSRPWDLNNRAITFTPSGGSYTVQTDPISAFPSGTSGFTNFDKTNLTSGTARYGGWWSHTLAAPFPFFGNNRNQLFVGNRGVIGFDTGVTSSGLISNLFRDSNPKIAPAWTNLDQSYGGEIAHRRISDGAESRTVIFYNNVSQSSTGIGLSCQVELFDDGRIRLSYLNIAIQSALSYVVGLSSGQNLPSSPYSDSSTPVPFFQSDFTLYPPSGAPANRAPVFASSPPLSATAGQAWSYPVSVEDIDPGQTLTISAPVKPAWLTLTPTGARSATLAGTPPAAGSYAVTLQVSDGSASTTQTFTLHAAAPGNAPPAFTSSPPATVLLGQAYTYSISAGDPEGDPLSFSALQRPSWLTLTDHGNGSATLSGTAPALAGENNPVTLVVSDAGGSAVQSYTLALLRPPEIEVLRPLGGIVETASLDLDLHLETAIVANGEALTLQWTRLSGPGSATFSDPAAASTRVHFDAAGLHVLQLTAHNGHGSATASISVYAATASGDPGINIAPLVIPGDAIEATPVQTIVLPGAVSDDSPTLDLLWTQESGPDAGSFGAASLADSSYTTGTQNGMYLLRLSADDGAAKTSAVLTVSVVGADPEAPVILSQPASLTVAEGQPASFSVSASGSPPPGYQWRKNSVEIPGATGPTLSFSAATLADANSYDVVVSNSEGDVTSDTVTLTVNPIPPQAPAITAHPQPQSVLAGQPASFSVSATGHPAPAYQWRKNSVDIPGATGAILDIASASAADAATYTVYVYNSAGNVTSNPAALSVNHAPSVSLTSPAAAAEYNQGTPIPLAASASDVDGDLLRVEFHAGATLLHSDSTAPYSYDWSSAPVGTHSLSATAIDAFGNRITSAAVSITVLSVTPPHDLLFQDVYAGTPGDALSTYNGNYVLSHSAAPQTLISEIATEGLAFDNLHTSGAAALIGAANTTYQGTTFSYWNNAADFEDVTASQDIYFSFLLHVPAAADMTGGFLGLQFALSPSRTLRVGLRNNGGSFLIGGIRDAGTGLPSTGVTVPDPFGQTLLVVGYIPSFGSGWANPTISLYVNPTERDTRPATAGATFSGGNAAELINLTGISLMAVKKDGNNQRTAGLIDEVRFGGTWAEVLPRPAVKTTPSVTWPAASGLDYGQTLADVIFSGGAASVDGSFAFDAPATLPAPGTASHPLRFLPSDTQAHNEVAGSIPVTVAPFETGALETAPGGAPGLRIASSPRLRYRLRYKNNLLDASWIDFDPPLVLDGTGGEIELSDPNPSAPLRFYILIAEPKP